jgi:hypothetical protein
MIMNRVKACGRHLVVRSLIARQASPVITRSAQFPQPINKEGLRMAPLNGVNYMTTT